MSAVMLRQVRTIKQKRPFKLSDRVPSIDIMKPAAYQQE